MSASLIISYLEKTQIKRRKNKMSSENKLKEKKKKECGNYYDWLCGDEDLERVKFSENISEEDIEKIKFLFRNCCYNKNRFEEEFNRDEGWKFDKGFFKHNNLKLKAQIPFTMWADIHVFEFNSFLFNVSRLINFLVKVELEMESIDTKRTPTINELLNEKRKAKFKSFKLYDFFKEENEKWVRFLNNLRNEITHKEIERKLEGYYKLDVRMDKKSDELVVKQEKIFEVKKYNIDNLKVYINMSLNNLTYLINEFMNRIEVNYQIKNKK